jgi:hypothetical protein
MPPSTVFDWGSSTHATYHTCEPRTGKEIGSWKETYHIWDPWSRYIHMRGLRWTKVTYYRTMHVVNDLPHTWNWDQEINGTLKGNLPQLGSMKRIKQRWGLQWTKVTYYRTMYVVNKKTQPYNETEPTPVEGGVRYKGHLIGKCFTTAMS